MTKAICLLGATGSIGRSTLDVVTTHPDHFRIETLTAGSNAVGLIEAARTHHPRTVVIADEEKFDLVSEALCALDCTILSGPEGICEAIQRSEADVCVSAIVGSAGLLPTLEAIRKGMDIALANKETLVAAGHLVMELVKKHGVRLLPVDSEHCALFQCLKGDQPESVEKLIITASGGPFRGKSQEALTAMTAADALAHPTWSMGPKITVDSATLANKALEVIEAHWLFSLPYEKIEVVVHPQSIVHSLVEFCDGTLLAQLGNPDMRAPIQYALSYPDRLPSPLARPDWQTLSGLTFEAPDREAFPLLDLGISAGRQGGTAPAVYSAANEQAVQYFLEGAFSFTHIYDCVADALEHVSHNDSPDLGTLLAAESEARERVARRIEA